jgi:hypothetical protein
MEEDPMNPCEKMGGRHRRPIVCCLALLASAVTAHPGAAAAPLVLAESGTAKAIILTPAPPSLVEKYAAGQMATFLSRITGGSFEIVEESAAPGIDEGRPVISIGRTALARDLAMQGPEWKRTNAEAFRIVRQGDALVLCGNQAGGACDNGTLWGVYAFLEMQGVGSYLPDPLGEVVPETPNLSIEELDFTDAPAFEMRGGDATMDGYLRRYELGGDKEGVAPNLLSFGRQAAARRVEFMHTWQYIANLGVRKEHPEWFENTRNSPHGPQPGPSPHIGYGLSETGICLSRPEIRNLFIEYIRERFRNNPDLYCASICPDDYVLGDRCPCPDCQRLLEMGGPPSFPDARGAPRSASDLLITFANAVAEGLEEEFPDRRLITYAYLDYLDPPATTRVHPNLIIMPAPLSLRNELNPGLDEMSKGWKRMGAKKLYWYSYILTRPPVPHLMGEWFRNYKRRGVEGVYIEFGQVPVINTLNGWLYGKLTWNPDVDVSVLIDEYCTGLFGPEVGRVMRRFFLAAWEVNPPLYDEIPGIFSAAEEMAGDRESLLSRRVRFVRLGWELYYSAIALDNALEAGDIARAHRIVTSGIEAAEMLKAEYPWAIRSNVWLHNTAHMEYSVTVLPALETLLNTKVARPNPEPVAPGPVLCLTGNANLPPGERMDAGATVQFSQAPDRDPSGAILFDGKLEGPENNLSPGSYPVWIITLDLKMDYQVDQVEVCTGLTNARWDIVPIYVEVQLSRDGEEFTPAERILPRTLKGFVRSSNLVTTARYVRLRMASLNMWHAVSEVRVWGRPIP